MNCDFRGCSCWYCSKNDPQFICKHYDQQCVKKQYKKAVINECEHFKLIDDRNIIFKKCDNIRKTFLKKSRDVKILLYLLIGKFKDYRDRFKEANTDGTIIEP